METIKWDDSLSVHIETIDYQHKKLVELINEFYEHIQKGSQKEKMQEVITALKKYTLFHFTTEEKLMTQHHYEGLVVHKKEHEAFVAKVLDFETRYNAGKMILSVEITNFLKNWVVNHIMGTDKKYSSFLTSKGVK